MTISEDMALPPTMSKKEVSASEMVITSQLVPSVTTKKSLESLLFRKPSKTEFVRVNPDPKYKQNFAILEIKDDREVYLVAPSLIQSMQNLVKLVTVYTVVNDRGNVFLTGVSLPDSLGKRNRWHDSLEHCLFLAQTRWVRLEADMPSQGYQITESDIDRDPDFPTQYTLIQLMDIAFRGKKILSEDHDVLRRLRGELL